MNCDIITAPHSPPSDISPRPTSSSTDIEEKGRKRAQSGEGSGGSSEAKRTANKICRVCGDKAFSYNFNVITCESCKAFFRRNANKARGAIFIHDEKEIRCPFNEQCEINVVSRRFCQRCRLRKCFDVGMKKEWIMTEEARLEKKHRVEENRERRMHDALARKGFPHESGRTSRTESTSSRRSVPPPSSQPTTQPVNTAKTEAPFYCPTPTILDALSEVLPPSTSSVTSPTSPIVFPKPSAPAPSFSSFPPSVSDSFISVESSILSSASFLPPPVHPTSSELIAAQAQLAVSLQFEQQLQAAAAAVAAASHSSPLAQPEAVQPLPPPAPSPLAGPSFLTASPLGGLGQALLLGSEVAVPASVVAAPMGVDELARRVEERVRRVTAASLEECCCRCSCGHFSPGTVIAKAVKEELEREKRREEDELRDSQGCSGLDIQLSGLLPADDTSVSWLRPSTAAVSDERMIFGASPGGSQQHITVIKDTAFPSPGIVSLRPLFDSEFGPLDTEDEEKMKELLNANQVWNQPLESTDHRLHEESSPTKMTMLAMMVGAVKRLIAMVKKLPALKALHETDQLKLIRGCYLDILIIRGAMAYDPKANAWKGPSPQSSYNIKLDAMNDGSHENMFHQSIRLYSMFKEEWRQNECVMLLLGQLTLFDPRVDGLSAVNAVKAEHDKYAKCLKRLLFLSLQSNAHKAQMEYNCLLERLATVRRMNQGAMTIMKEHADKMDPLLRELLPQAEH